MDSINTNSPKKLAFVTSLSDAKNLTKKIIARLVTPPEIR